MARLDFGRGAIPPYVGGVRTDKWDYEFLASRKIFPKKLTDEEKKIVDAGDPIPERGFLLNPGHWNAAGDLRRPKIVTGIVFVAIVYCDLGLLGSWKFLQWTMCHSSDVFTSTRDGSLASLRSFLRRLRKPFRVALELDLDERVSDAWVEMVARYEKANEKPTSDQEDDGEWVEFETETIRPDGTRAPVRGRRPTWRPRERAKSGDVNEAATTEART